MLYNILGMLYNIMMSYNTSQAQLTLEEKVCYT